MMRSSARRGYEWRVLLVRGRRCTRHELYRQQCMRGPAFRIWRNGRLQVHLILTRMCRGEVGCSALRVEYFFLLILKIEIM